MSRLRLAILREPISTNGYSLGLCYPQEPHDPYGSRQSGSHGGHAEAHGQQYVTIHPRKQIYANEIQWTLKCAPSSRPSEKTAP